MDDSILSPVTTGNHYSVKGLLWTEGNLDTGDLTSPDPTFFSPASACLSLRFPFIHHGYLPPSVSYPNLSLLHLEFQNPRRSTDHHDDDAQRFKLQDLYDSGSLRARKDRDVLSTILRCLYFWRNIELWSHSHGRHSS